MVRRKLFLGGAASGRRRQAAARLRQARYQGQSRRLSVGRLVRASLADVYVRRQRVQAFGLSLATNLGGRAALSPSKGAGPPIAGQNDSSRVLSAIRWLAISGGRAAETPSISASAPTPLLGR